MLDGADNSRFWTIKTNIENKMTCGPDSSPKTKEKTVVLINNYHLSKQLTRVIPVKEEVEFAQKISDTKKIRTNKKG